MFSCLGELNGYLSHLAVRTDVPTSWDISGDPIYVGGQNRELFDHPMRDPISFLIYVMVMHTLAGPKPKPSGRWVVDRVDNSYHYTVGNMRWLSQASNALNRTQKIRCSRSIFKRYTSRTRIFGILRGNTSRQRTTRRAYGTRR